MITAILVMIFIKSLILTRISISGKYDANLFGDNSMFAMWNFLMKRHSANGFIDFLFSFSRLELFAAGEAHFFSLILLVLLWLLMLRV